MKSHIFDYSRWKESFGLKIFGAFVLVIVTVSFVFTLINVGHEIGEMRERLTTKGELLTGLLANSTRTGVFAENSALLGDAAEGIMRIDEVSSVSIYNADRKILFSSYKKAVRKTDEGILGEKYESVVAGLANRRSVGTIEDEDSVELLRPVIIEEFLRPEEAIYFDTKYLAKSEKVIGYVRVIMDKSPQKKAVESIVAKNALIALAFLFSGLIIIYFTVRWVTRPLLGLTEAVRRLGKGEEAGEVAVESNDEIGKLAVAFNAMAESLRAREAEKAKLEEKLRHAEKMEAVGTLARGVAHDFNNIMAAVLGAVYLMHRKMEPDNPFRENVERIQVSVSRAKSLVKALLAFSKGLMTYPVELDISENIRGMLPVLQGFAGDKVVFETSFQGGPLMIKGDPLQLEQVMVNLVTNARDAMPEGGTIRIEIRKPDSGEVEEKLKALLPTHPLNLASPAGLAEIDLSDTGDGIDKRIQDRIYEPFFTTKEVDKGTGLGLSIIFGIIEHHRGHVEFQSEKGKGTRFRIYLPLTATDTGDLKP